MIREKEITFKEFGDKSEIWRRGGGDKILSRKKL